MENLNYFIYCESDYYISQCLNIEVASFGNSIDKALANVKEAEALYLEDESEIKIKPKSC